MLLDGLCIRGVLDWPCSCLKQELWLHGSRRIEEEELKIRGFDLSRTLIEEWADVVGICSALRSLKIVKLEWVYRVTRKKERLIYSSGNRFRDLSLPKTGQWRDVFLGVTELSLDKTFLSWDEVFALLQPKLFGLLKLCCRYSPFSPLSPR